MENLAENTMSVDNHSHIILADIIQMVASARAKNVKRYSITEHVSQFKELRISVGFGSTHESGRILENLKEYLGEFAKVEYPGSVGMKINNGLEVDFAPRYERVVGNYVNQESWDTLLCSVHELEDGTDIEKNLGNTTTKTHAHKNWRDYLKLEQMALESDFVPFGVLTHPVRMSRMTQEVPDEFDDLLLNLGKTARRRNKALELNGRDLEFAPDLVRRLAIACSKSNCKVSFGSDAHRPEDILRKVQDANALVKEFNLEVI